MRSKSLMCVILLQGLGGPSHGPSALPWSWVSSPRWMSSATSNSSSTAEIYGSFHVGMINADISASLNLWKMGVASIHTSVTSVCDDSLIPEMHMVTSTDKHTSPPCSTQNLGVSNRHIQDRVQATIRTRCCVVSQKSHKARARAPVQMWYSQC